MKIYQEVTNSSAIAAFEYDTKTEILTVRFVRGETSYDYPGIPEEVVRNWLQAESMGRYFHNNIRSYVG